MKKQGPTCGKCSVVSEERWLINTSYWYCVKCKDEVKNEPPKKLGSLYKGYYDPALVVPNSLIGNGFSIQPAGNIQIRLDPKNCSHNKLTRDVVTGFWSCDDCGTVTYDPFALIKP